jgi:MFS family permease
VLVSVYMPVEGVLLPVEFEAQDQPGRLGLVIMAMSLGAIGGALAYGLIGRTWRRSLVFRGSLISTGVFLLALAALPPFGVMLAAALFIGFSYGPQGPLANIAMQTRSPERMRGRVVGIITSTQYAAGPFGYLLVGAATERFGVQPTFLAIAALVLLVALAGLAVRPLQELDTLPDELAGAGELDAEATLEAALDIATSGPVPLVRPPRDPETLRHERDRP